MTHVSGKKKKNSIILFVDVAVVLRPKLIKLHKSNKGEDHRCRKVSDTRVIPNSDFHDHNLTGPQYIQAPYQLEIILGKSFIEIILDFGGNFGLQRYTIIHRSMFALIVHRLMGS